MCNGGLLGVVPEEDISKISSSPYGQIASSFDGDIARYLYINRMGGGFYIEINLAEFYAAGECQNELRDEVLSAVYNFLRDDERLVMIGSILESRVLR